MPRKEQRMDARARNRMELGLPATEGAAETIAGQIPGLNLLTGLAKGADLRQRLTNPELLHNTVGKELGTNVMRGGPDDKFGPDTQMMAEGGVVAAEKEDADIPADVQEYIDAIHKERQEARPDEGWRIKPKDAPESAVPYNTNEDAEPSILDQLRGMVGMADGGVVDDLGNQNLQTIADLSGVSGMMPELAPPQEDEGEKWARTIGAQGEGPGPNEAMPAAPAPVSGAPGVKAPGLTDQDFMDRANKILGLNPQEQAGFMKLLGQNQQRSQLGAAVAGIGDAIASGGTLGKVNPGALQKSEDLANNATRQGLEGMQTIRENQDKAQELADKLEMRDPNSPLSKWAQKAYGSVGRKLGLDLTHAPASLIGDITGKGVDALNTEFQNQLKLMQLDLQKQQLAATVANQQSERELAKEGKVIESAKTLADRGITDKIAGMIPGTSANTATKVLEATAKGQNAVGPYGTETIRNGKTYEWSPETGKYHLKR